MADIKVIFSIKEKPSKEKVNEKLNWYDNIKQEMLTFHGGKLTFKYKEDKYLVKMGEEERLRKGIKSTYRMLPEVEDLQVDNHFDMVKETNQKKIEDWFYNSEYADESTIESMSNNSINFNVPDNMEEDFYRDLEGQGFKYE